MLPQRGNKTYRLTVSLLYIPKAYTEYIIDISLFIRVCVHIIIHLMIHIHTYSCYYVLSCRLC